MLQEPQKYLKYHSESKSIHYQILVNLVNLACSFHKPKLSFKTSVLQGFLNPRKCRVV